MNEAKPNPTEFVNWRGLTLTQVKFLRGCREEPATLEELVERLQLQPYRLSRWLRDAKFRSHLAQVLREVRRRRDVDLEFGAKRAVGTLVRIATGAAGVPTTDVARQACVDLLRLVYGIRRRRRRSAQQKQLPPHDPLPAGMTEEQARQLLEDFDRVEGGQNDQAPNPKDR